MGSPPTVILDAASSALTTGTKFSFGGADMESASSTSLIWKRGRNAGRHSI